MPTFPDPDFGKRQQAWRRHVPDAVTVLFVAEAPPAEDRYFYYPESTKHDHLFINMMRAVFPGLQNASTEHLKTNKPRLLKRFKDSGYLLIDAIERRIPSSTPKPQRIALIKDNEDRLLERAANLQGNFQTYLIKKSVFTGLSDNAKRSLRVAHSEFIPFPSNGNQPKFRQKLRDLLRTNGHPG